MIFHLYYIIWEVEMIKMFNKYINHKLIIDKEVLFDLNDVYKVPLHIEINISAIFIDIIFQWKLPKNKLLSHIFKVNDKDYYFNSNPEGNIHIERTNELIIKHTYEYFGLLNWENIEINSELYP